MVTLSQLVGVDAAHRLSSLGLHKVAAATLNAEGYKVGEALDLRSAIQTLATKVFLKNAEYRAIVDGLAALETLTRG